MLNKGAFAFKIVQGALKWPLMGGSHLIEVAATAGLTVSQFLQLDEMCIKKYSVNHDQTAPSGVT